MRSISLDRLELSALFIQSMLSNPAIIQGVPEVFKSERIVDAGLRMAEDLMKKINEEPEHPDAWRGDKVR